MTLKLLKFTILILTISMSLLLEGGAMQSRDIELVAKLNKASFKVDDDFILILKISNNSDNPIRILPWVGLFEYSWFKITNAKGEKNETSDKVKFELDPRFPFKSSYILLLPRNSYDVVLKGRVIKNRIDILGGKVFDGLFIDFQNSRILIKDFGEYCIDAEFSNDDFIKKEAKEKYGFDDLWQGEVTSNKIKFKILNE